jgi:hypothetical protein
MKFSSIVMTALLMAVTSHAAEVSVQSAVNCAQWAQSRTSGRSALYESFFLGLINGMSLGSGVEFWNAKPVEVTREQAIFWLDKFCDKNPLSDMYLGAFSLLNEHTDGEYYRQVSR